MSKDTFGSISAGSADWDEAWKSVRRLAEARQSVVKGAATRDLSTAGTETSNPVSPLVTDGDADEVVSISQQAQQDLAEIESALAALRNAQPDLEAWSIPKAAVAQPQKPRSVWLVVGVVWVSTVLLMAMATFAIASLLR